MGKRLVCYRFIKSVLIIVLLLTIDFTIVVTLTITGDKYEFINHEKAYTYNELFNFDESKTDILNNLLIYTDLNDLGIVTLKGKDIFEKVKFVPLNPFLSESVLILYNRSNDIGTFHIDIYIDDNGGSNDERMYLLKEGCMVYGELFIFNNSVYLYSEYQTDKFRGTADFVQEFGYYNYLPNGYEKVGVYKLEGIDVKFFNDNFESKAPNAFKLNPWWWTEVTTSVIVKMLIFFLFVLQFAFMYKLCDKLFYRRLFKSCEINK